MINRDHELPIKRQAELLNISRGTVPSARHNLSPLLIIIQIVRT